MTSWVESDMDCTPTFYLTWNPVQRPLMTLFKYEYIIMIIIPDRTGGNIHIQGTAGYTACTLQLKQGTWSVHDIYPVPTVMVYSRLQGIYSAQAVYPVKSLQSTWRVHCDYTSCILNLYSSSVWECNKLPTIFRIHSMVYFLAHLCMCTVGSYVYASFVSVCDLTKIQTR